MEYTYECLRCHQTFSVVRAENRGHQRKVCDECRPLWRQEWEKLYMASDRPAAIRRRERHRTPEAQRRSWLRYAYGITPEQWDEMFARQGGLCALCRRPRKLSVDHDHATKRVRGLLCKPCNNTLSEWGDNEERLVAYLG